LRQEDAAAIIGIRATFISSIENGHRGCRFHTLLAILRAYNADLHQLARAFDAAQSN
jgi:transcriptional regulator with XRE-family HTH domain